MCGKLRKTHGNISFYLDLTSMRYHSLTIFTFDFKFKNTKLVTVHGVSIGIPVVFLKRVSISSLLKVRTLTEITH